MQTNERKKKIKQSAERIVESFEKATKEIPPLEETYYIKDIPHTLRSDGELLSKEKRSDFRSRFKSIMPASDENGNLKVEIAKWTE